MSNKGTHADRHFHRLIHLILEGCSPQQMGRKGLSNHHWIVGGKLCVRIVWNRAIASVAARTVRVSNSPRLCRRCPTRISWCAAISATYPSRCSRLLAHPAIMRVAGDDSPLRPDTHRQLLSDNGVARTLSMVGLPTSLAQRLVGGTVRWPDPRTQVARRGMPRRHHTTGATACRCSRGKPYWGRCRPPGGLHCRHHIDAACYPPSRCAPAILGTDLTRHPPPRRGVAPVPGKSSPR